MAAIFKRNNQHINRHQLVKKIRAAGTKLATLKFEIR